MSETLLILSAQIRIWTAAPLRSCGSSRQLRCWNSKTTLRCKWVTRR